MPSRFRPPAVAVTLAVLSVSILVAQERPTFRSGVDTVEVHVTVRGPGGDLVRGLTKDDFELLDNGKRQEISVFSSDVQAIAVALLIDRSGSVSRDADKIAAAAGAFVGELRPDDQAALNTLTMECQPLTNDKAALNAKLRSNMQMDMGSPVWAGVDRTITSLGGIGGRRAILLFSDGDDFGPAMPMSNLPQGLPLAPMAGSCRPWPDPSEASLSDASRRAQREGIMVYTVSVEGSGGGFDGDLRSIARGSGGERYRLKDESELTAAFTRIVDELHHQYLLGFTPQTLDGKVHPLVVRVKKGGLSVRARESYVALPVNRAVPGVAAPVAPVAPLSDAAIADAVRAGSSGQKLQAACTASGDFPRRPPENELFSEVVLEGPTGRIMRAAREARARKSTFTSADVTADLRAPVVLVTSQLKRSTGAATLPADNPANPPPFITPTPTPSPSPTATFVPAAVIAVRLRSKLLTEVMLRPLPAEPVRGFVAPPLRVGGTRVDRFDLAAFQALPGQDVEIVVRSSAGPRQCSIGPKERAAVR